MSDQNLAQLKGKKRRGNLSLPPTPEEVKGNIHAPETAPVKKTIRKKKQEKQKRSVSFATKITADMHKRIKVVAAMDEKTIVEVLEESFELYEKKYKHKKI